jgi:hypothetical protein
VFASIIGPFFVECKKQETLPNDKASQSLIDNALSEQEFMSMLPGVIHSLLIAEGNISATNSCDSIHFLGGDTSDFIPNPKYNLNLSGTECSVFFKDHKIRSGQIVIQTNGKITGSGTRLILKTTNYLSDGLSYKCDSAIINILSTNSSQMKLTVDWVNGICSGSGFIINYRAQKNVELNKQDLSSPFFSVSSVTGEATGTNRFGMNYQTYSNSNDAQIMNVECRYFVKGRQEITHEGKPKMNVNYGNGECDEIATHNIFENTVEFKLK